MSAVVEMAGVRGQVDDLADVAELVEAARPVVTHHQDVGVELLDVVPLELEALLDEDLVDHPQRPDDRHPLALAEDRLAALLAQVERVGRHPDHQPVAQGSGALDHPEVADVEDVEGAEGDHRAHGRHCGTRPVRLLARAWARIGR